MSDFELNKRYYLNLPLEEKRKSYACKYDYTKLDEIVPWSIIAKEKEVKKVETDFSANEVINSKVALFIGDITKLEIDCIVNAANQQLIGGGGVDGAIHKAAGTKMLQDECRTLGGCKAGFSKLTGGYKLPAKYICHTVGPIGEIPDVLYSCYRSSMELMKQNNLRSIAFPCISTGVYGYPSKAAAHIALRTIRVWLEENLDKVDMVIFCLFLEKDVSEYNILMHKYFPVQ